MSVQALKRIVAVATLAALPLQAAAVAQELTQPLLKLTAVGGIDYLPELFEETVAPEPVVAPLPAPAPMKPVVVKPAEPQVRSVSQGEASWYGPGFFGNLTANGEIYSPGTMTAAHRTLPFGTRVRVTNLWNGRSAVVRINDRGPYVGQRVIDLGHGAAGELGLFHSGIAQVKLEVLQ